MFRDYDLSKMGIPESAWPCSSKEHKGNKGYTVTSPNGAAIEVLCSAGAYCVKRLGTVNGKTVSGDVLKTGQVTWSKFDGPVNAWEIAKTRAGFCA
ncbi:30S ribosomal protein S6 [Durusdinium trenchii]|uniref:30S ribosomal protein S6 n=1 Tax=Durusdinium trenchii TaxID=1381693 RepID=A0ABP0HBE9_9DINO